MHTVQLCILHRIGVYESSETKLSYASMWLCVSKSEYIFFWSKPSLNIQSLIVTIYFQLHQLMPSMITCIVAKRLGHRFVDNHWGLRDFSAKLVASVCQRWNFYILFPILCGASTTLILISHWHSFKLVPFSLIIIFKIKYVQCEYETLNCKK